MKQLMSGVVLCFCMLTGCAPTQRSSPPINFNEIHAANFIPISKFYCERGRWPTDIEELKGFADDRSIDAPLGFYQDAQLSTPREVELFIAYNTRSTGVETKEAVSFKASPCDSGKESGIVNLAAGQVLFPLPRGFRMLSVGEIEKRYGKGPYPDFAYIHDSSMAMVSVRFGDTPYDNSTANSRLTDLVASYSQSTSGLKWVDKQVIVRDGVPWIKLAMEGDSTIGRLYSEMYFTSFKGKAFALYFVSPVDRLAGMRGAFQDSFRSIRMRPRSRTTIASSSLDNDNRAALAIERLTPNSIRLRDVVLKIDSHKWEIAKEEESRGIPSVDLLYKASEGMLKATIQVLPAVVQEDSYLEVVSRGMKGTNETIKSGPITTKTFANRNFRCRRNDMTLKDLLPFTIETCVASTRLKSVMLIFGAAANLYDSSAKTYSELMDGLELGE